MNNLDVLLSENKFKKILLLVSGGSAFEVLNEINYKSWNKNITIGMIDERYSMDSSVNNFSQMKNQLFWKNVIKARCGAINTEVNKMDTFGGATIKFERQIKKWKKDNKKGKVVVLLGMGEDGHTAGIMPYPNEAATFNALFINTEKWIVGYDCGDRNQYRQRMTATMYFLENCIDKCFVYFRGEKKKEMFESRVNKKIEECPIKIVDNFEYELL